MRIFILPTSYPDESNKVANIFIYEQAKMLAEQGHEIVVLHVKKLPSSNILSLIDHSIIRVDDGFSIRFTVKIKTFLEDRFPQFTRRNFIRTAFRLYEHAVEMVGIPDVIYGHFSCWAGRAATEIASKYGVPCVVMEHSGDFIKPGKKLSKVLIKCLGETISASNRFICVSDNLRDAIIKYVPNDEIHVIPNMVDKSFAYHARTEKRNFVFLSIGRLVDSKRMDLLIESFIQAFSIDDNVELRIGGEGEERQRLEKIIQSNGREKQIYLLGRLSREQTLEQYIDCDCFVLPSRWETFGIVYREAMAVGRPIITTNHGGFKIESWDDSVGYIIPVDNQNELEDKLKLMISSYEKFDPKSISKKCLDMCGPDTVIDKINCQLLAATNLQNHM